MTTILYGYPNQQNDFTLKLRLTWVSSLREYKRIDWKHNYINGYNINYTFNYLLEVNIFLDMLILPIDFIENVPKVF